MNQQPSPIIPCLHCGTPVPRFRSPSLYCCSGCQSAADIIASLSLDSFYTLKEKEAFVPSQPVRPIGGSFEYFDDPTYQSTFVNTNQDGTISAALQVDGIHCIGCLWLLENLPRIFPAAQESTVNLAESTIRLTFNPSGLRLSEIARLLDKLGYQLSPEGPRDSALSNRPALLRIGVAAVCSMNIQMVAVSLYQGYVTGIPAEYAALFAWGALLLTIPVMLYSARPIFNGALQALRVGAPALDIPLSLGIIAGFIFSLWATIYAPVLVYYDVIATLVLLILAGRFIQEAALRKSRRLTARALRFLPDRAQRQSADGFKSVPSSLLSATDIILVAPGDRLPADGEILSGNSSIDESLLTGESNPRQVSSGSAVFAGTLNLQAPLTIRLSSAADSSRVAVMLQSLRKTGSKAKLVQYVDRLSRAFVVIVIALSIATFFYWLSTDVNTALHNSIALLIVTCPCALALGVPLAIGVTIGKAAQRGVIIKGDDAFERLLETTVIVLDKTGTLTRGELSIASIQKGLNANGAEMEAVATSLAAVAPSHPISQTLLRELASTSISSINWRAVEYLPGCGVEGRDNHDCIWRLGSSEWTGVSWSENQTAIHLTKDGDLVGTIVFHDDLRPESMEVVAALQCRYPVYILSGDSESSTRHVGELVGIPPERCLGTYSPEQKRQFVNSLPGNVTMIGDGFNDAVAMQSAFLAIGIRGALASNVQSSDIFVTSGGLRAVSESFEAANRLRNLVGILFVTSFVYNIVGAALAVAGYVHPLAAAILMPISSLSTVLMAILIPCFRSENRWR